MIQAICRCICRWHEVLTLESKTEARVSRGGAKCETDVEPPTQPLTVSVNFWFDTQSVRLQQLQLPLTSTMQLELARQLEYFTSDVLRDQAWLVPRFFGAMRRQLEGILAGACAVSSASLATSLGAFP